MLVTGVHFSSGSLTAISLEYAAGATVGFNQWQIHTILKPRLPLSIVGALVARLKAGGQQGVYMNESPKILILSDEPMLLVDMLYEFEDRGFTVEPRNRGDYAMCSNEHEIDAAVFDFRRADDLDLQFASRLRQSGIPMVVFGGGSSTIPVEISGSAFCIAKPVDYDEVTAILQRLVNRVTVSDAIARGGAIPFSEGVTADRS
jgi:ActR/RegA family two-component response regulator